MCTSIAIPGGFYGRNLDLEYSFGETVALTPRSFPLRFCRQPGQPRHYAMVGMASVAEGYPLYAEAANERGLYMAGLNFPVSARYCAQVPEGCAAVAPWELIPWVLGQCETLRQARALLENFRPLAEPFSPALPLSPLHWHIADRTEAMVLECTEQGVTLYDDPAGVLTNEPPFPFHLQNLAMHQSLSPRQPEPSMGLPLSGQGMGSVGLPGDFSPAGRYVKAAFLCRHSPPMEKEAAQVAQVFHILDAVAMVRGGVIIPEGRWDITTYACCFSADSGTYYYKTCGNNRLNAVRLAAETVSGGTLALFPVETAQDVLFRN